MTRSTSSTEMLRWLSHAFISFTNDSNAGTPLIRPRTGWWTSGSPENDSSSASNSPANRPSKNGTSTSSCCHFSCSRCSTGTENSSGSHGIQQAFHSPPGEARARCRRHLEDPASPPAKRSEGAPTVRFGFLPGGVLATVEPQPHLAKHRTRRLDSKGAASWPGEGATSSTSCVCCSCDRSRTRSGRARDPRGRLGPRMRSGLVSIWCDSLLGPAGRSSVARILDQSSTELVMRNPGEAAIAGGRGR